MLLSLGLIQAHAVVPHHHHAGEHQMHVHEHNATEHDELHADHEQAPHDEAFLGAEAKHRVHHLDIAIPLLPGRVVVSCGAFEALAKIAARPDHPPVHGPPRHCDPRGPPTPLAA